MTYGELSSTLKETYLRDDWEGGESGKPSNSHENGSTILREMVGLG